jgi:hypothetical protein
MIKSGLMTHPGVNDLRRPRRNLSETLVALGGGLFGH